MTQLSDDGAATLVELAPTTHPLPEHRATWRVQEPDNIAVAGTGDTDVATATDLWPSAPRLLLQLLPEPHRIAVTTTERRGAPIPIGFRSPDGRATKLLTTLDPDHVSADAAGAPYARAYFTCLTDNGLLVLLYRDALAGIWYLHGWWD